MNQQAGCVGCAMETGIEVTVPGFWGNYRQYFMGGVERDAGLTPELGGTAAIGPPSAACTGSEVIAEDAVAIPQEMPWRAVPREGMTE